MESELAKQKNNPNFCVLIPTYNNERTLKRVIDGVFAQTKDIIIVNDGSTDSTSKILKDYSHLEQIHLPKNKGKGNALRQGFKKAIELKFDYAITIDSDGQHFPEDIPVFLNTLEASDTPNLLLIGARNMTQESVPKKSSFGNKFSNFWFWFMTTIKLQDTQSGFRLYPLEVIKNLKLRTNKFEFEIEIIVKSAWKGTLVQNVPIKVLYDETERVSHFRPFKDFTRISILNLYFVFVTLFYIKPRDLYRRYKKKGIKRFIMEDFLGSSDSPRKKGSSIALGVFVGLTPFWGFHTIIALSSAYVLKLNKTIAFAFSNVSLPPFIPFIVYASSVIGQYLLGEDHSYTFEEISENWMVFKYLKAYVLGSFTLAIVASATLGLFGYLFFTVFDKKKPALNNG